MKAPCTIVNVDAPCMTCPRDIDPSRNLGAHRMIGSTGAMNPEVWDTLVVFMVCTAMSRQADKTLRSDRARPARSSSSPWISATLSPFSRRRVRR